MHFANKNALNKNWSKVSQAFFLDVRRIIFEVEKPPFDFGIFGKKSQFLTKEFKDDALFLVFLKAVFSLYLIKDRSGPLITKISKNQQV